MNIIATIIQDKYGYEEYLYFENADTNETLVKIYFDICKPYLTPRTFLHILDKLGVTYELKVIKDKER